MFYDMARVATLRRRVALEMARVSALESEALNRGSRILLQIASRYLTDIEGPIMLGKLDCGNDSTAEHEDGILSRAEAVFGLAAHHRQDAEDTKEMSVRPVMAIVG